MEEIKATAHREMRAMAGAQIESSTPCAPRCPEDGIFVDEMTQMGYVSQSAFPVHAPRTFISSGTRARLGPASRRLGAQVACPGRAVLSINGDGGFMFNAQELSTAVQQGLGVVAVVFEDGAYGNVKRMQEDLHGGRVIASELHNPDFVRYAESFGARECAWTRRTRCATPSPPRGGGASRPSSACASAVSRSRSTRCCRWRPCARGERGVRETPLPHAPAGPKRTARA